MSARRERADDLTPAALQRHLRAATFGHRIYYYPVIASTNDRALELAAAGEEEGAVVVAEAQTRGRGRRDRTWESPPGAGIYASIVLRPALPAARAPLLTFQAAVAVARGLRETAAVPAGIKWPNDVVVKRRKIAGILAESRGGDAVVRDMVIGIGVNVNQAAADFPEGLRAGATSVRIETGRRAARAPILAAILTVLERGYARLLRAGPADLLREWEALSAIPRGGRILVTGAGGTREGTVAGLDEEGALLLATPGGTERVAFGEIVRADWS